MRKLKKFDLFLFIGFLAISMAAGYLSYRMYVSPRSANAVRVGYLAQTPGDVFRKGRDDFFYSQERTNSVIYNLDQITTGTESQAEIKLDQGSSIRLEQLSHILVSVNNGIYSLDIKGGSSRATLSSDHALLIDGTRVIAPHNGEAELLYSKVDGESEIHVLRGQVKVTNGEQEKILSVDQGLTKLGSSGEALQALTLIRPAPAEQIISATRQVELSWEGFGDDTRYSIEIIKEGQVVQSFEVSDSKIQVTLTADGEYQWRVSAINRKKIAESEIRSFQLGTDAGFELLLPKHNDLLTFKAPNVDIAVAFQFKSKAKEPWLFIENLKNKEVLKSKTAAESMSVNLSNSHYRWGLSLNETDLPTLWNAFEVRKLEIPKKLPKKILPTTTMPLPVTTLPRPPPTTTLAMKVSPNGIEIPSIVDPKADSEIKATGETTKVSIRLASKTCNLYEVEADSDRTFPLPIIKRTAKPETVMPLKKGIYYLHARCWKTGDMGTWSDAIRIELK